ncbi:hypothetical protein NC653_005338 [Populus alba x Populus x berolinensis]|uniref:Uncharacterized protein n=1 Tax=Populus alba x Populus x berolinensis TaxID=444605 RepID=A0AAD6WBR4_9ROSI|nr:hypothetical protein NC653_005338 [Populus alba x Populus x berolinensis]
MAKTAFVPIEDQGETISDHMNQAASYAKESLESMSNSLGDKMEDAKETSCHGGLGHGFSFGKSSTKRRSRTGTRAGTHIISRPTRHQTWIG